MANHLYTYDDPPAERDLAKVVSLFESDGVIAYPTDVNWAIGCDAGSAKALDRIHRLKPSHPKDRPFALICSSISMAAEYTVIDNAAYRVLKRAWPGEFTVLLQASRSFPRQLKDKRRVVGIRIPAAPLVRAMVERLGRPIATTSVPAIRADGGPADAGDLEDVRIPRWGYEVLEAFGHALDLVVDLGQELPGLETTIVDLVDGVPTLVRRGAGDLTLFDWE